MANGFEDAPLKFNQILQKSPQLVNHLSSSGYAKCSHCGIVKKTFLSVKTTNPHNKFAWQEIPDICNDCLRQINKILPKTKEQPVKEKFVEDKQKTAVELDAIRSLKKFV